MSQLLPDTAIQLGQELVSAHRQPSVGGRKSDLKDDIVVEDYYLSLKMKADPTASTTIQLPSPLALAKQTPGLHSSPAKLSIRYTVLPGQLFQCKVCDLVTVERGWKEMSH